MHARHDRVSGCDWIRGEIQALEQAARVLRDDRRITAHGCGPGVRREGPLRTADDHGVDLEFPEFCGQR